MRSTAKTSLLLIGSVFFSFADPAQAFELSMAADLLTVRAKNTPLREILARFQEAGVTVAIDERIHPLVNVQFENREMGEGIKRLLADCDYALTWQTIEGPAGKMRQIAEIFVYKPGDRRPLSSLPAPPPVATENRLSHTNSIICLRNEILLRLRPGTTQEQFLALLRDTRLTVMNSLPALGLYRLHFPPGTSLADLLNRLAQNPLVAQVEPNQIYRSISPVTSSLPQGSGETYPIPKGSGSAVAILDSGFSPNAALEKAVLATLDATAPGTPISDPAGHGTQMAFIASGAVSPEGGMSLLSSQTGAIIPIRAMDNNGITSSFTLMQGMIFALDQGARVINMSWGSETDSGFFNDAVAYARQRGAVLVAAAGNEPTGRPIYPAANPSVVAVAALDPAGTLWDQSNYASFIKLAAPGFANLPIGYQGAPGGYGGTSIAAAYTARIISQYFTAHPDATAEEALYALSRTLSPPPDGSARSGIPKLDATAVSAFLK